MPTPDDVPAERPIVTPSALTRSIQTSICPIEESRPTSIELPNTTHVQDPQHDPIDPTPLAGHVSPRVLRHAPAHVTDTPQLNVSQDALMVPTIRSMSNHSDAQVPTDPNDDTAKSAMDPSVPIAIPSSKPINSNLPPTLHTPDTYETPYRSIPRHTSSFLRNGSKFVGTQQSDRQIYNVEVDIKYVDMNESFICGYLRIEGLTEDHPTLTTYFEGEIVGNKYSFRTRHPTWGSNEKVDMQHWSRFSAWRPLAQKARKPEFSYKDFADKEHIFMRWKEAFLVPDHKVRSISGASFEGFYYICFNQMNGTVSGIYFHSKSEKFQQLELRHVDDRGCYGALEFR